MKTYWSDSNIDIYHGDCLDILPSMEGKVDVVLTDPPFGINYQNNFTNNIHSKILNDDTKFPYDGWGHLATALLNNNSALFAFTGWSEFPDHFRQLQTCGLLMKEPLIVQKRPSGKTDLYGSFQSNTDWILFAHKGRFRFKATKLVRNKKAGTIPNPGRKPVPQYKTRFPSCWMGVEYPWATENPSSVKQWRHPTIKGLELMKWLILLSTNEQGVVLDPFCGSGTTMLAAKNTGRKAIGIEKDEKYCEMTVQRLTQCKEQ